VFLYGQQKSLFSRTKLGSNRHEKKGFSNQEILAELGRKKSQIKTWMRWYRNGEPISFGEAIYVLL
jgi:transposase